MCADCARKTEFHLEATNFDVFYLSVLEQCGREDRKQKSNQISHIVRSLAFSIFGMHYVATSTTILINF
jgi:hypothetical protein